MYLTIKQHDAFRNLLMGFEIPFRAYIADIITKAFTVDTDFEVAMTTKNQQITASSPTFLRETLGKAVRHNTLRQTYQKFVTAKTSVGEIVTSDIDIPMIGALNLVTFALVECFQDLYSVSGSYMKYCDCAEIYRYCRNKLDHPGCRTLEDAHLVPVLSFVKDICTFIDDKYFLQKTREQLLAEIVALQQRKTIMPIAKNNFSDMPYNESKVVCREDEIQKIKDFVYGTPGNLRKQHSYCIYGYGGVGKTALVLESLKQIVRDILDGTTIDEYSPKYVFFFSAKRRKLTLTQESGIFIEQQIRWHFETADELIDLIHTSLQRENLRGFHDDGLIVVDNLESLSLDDRIRIKTFIDTQTPSEMQFILTSRNSEEYETNVKLAGFEYDNGKTFIQLYNEENNLEIELTDEEMIELVTLSKGNTLVLVLSLRRLSQHLLSLGTLKAEFSSRNAWKSLRTNLQNTPSNAYEVIADFMFKDTFEHIENTFAENIDLFYRILKVFAIIQNGSTDINTICLLTKEAYPNVESVIDTLCNYLILEKKDTQYSLNSFAEKYIVGKFMPDAETYNQLSEEIASRQREVRSALERLEHDIESRSSLANILKDWQINSDIDRITAAKMYRLYGDVNNACRNSARLQVEWALESFVTECYEAESVTAHPFVKYQEARILQIVDRSGILAEKHEAAIKKAFSDCIFSIKTIEQYAGIQQTKSYASLLWLYGQYLIDIKEFSTAMRYLEESKVSFEEQRITDVEYYQCLARLGEAYLVYYQEDQQNRITYLRKARTICRQILSTNDYIGNAYSQAKRLQSQLQRFGQY